MVKIFFLQKFEVVFGFVYLFSIYMHQAVFDKYVRMQNLALEALVGNYFWVFIRLVVTRNGLSK